MKNESVGSQSDSFWGIKYYKRKIRKIITSYKREAIPS